MISKLTALTLSAQNTKTNKQRGLKTVQHGKKQQELALLPTADIKTQIPLTPSQNTITIREYADTVKTMQRV